MKSLLEMFPRASKAFLAANKQPDVAPVVAKLSRGSPMNKTEAEFAMILEARKRRGEILRYEYEGITLRWADMKYTPDFLVLDQRNFDNVTRMTLIEIKGGHIWDRDIVRFKGARAYWPEFRFEMWQKKHHHDQWLRIH